MTLQKLSSLTEQVEIDSFVHSLNVMCRLNVVTKERRLRGRHETSVVKFEVSKTFTNLTQHPTSVMNLDLKKFERFVILMYRFDVY